MIYKKFSKCTILILSAVFIVAISVGTASANYIALNTLQSSSIDSQNSVWEMGDMITITAKAPNMGPFPAYHFHPDADFYLSTTRSYEFQLTSYSGYMYEGSFSIMNEDNSLSLFADFNNLMVMSQINASGDQSFVLFTNTFSNTGGNLIEENTALSGLFIGMTLQDTGITSFEGILMGSGLKPPPPSQNPEPATFFLFGFGLLGIAGIGRQRHMN